MYQDYRISTNINEDHQRFTKMYEGYRLFTKMYEGNRQSRNCCINSKFYETLRKKPKITEHITNDISEDTKKPKIIENSKKILKVSYNSTKTTEDFRTIENLEILEMNLQLQF